MSKTQKTNSRRGSNLDAFLKDERIYSAVVAQAEKELASPKPSTKPLKASKKA